MTECNGCGACCDPVVSVVSPLMLQRQTADEIIGADEADWMRVHLTPIRPRRAGLDKVSGWMKGVSQFQQPATGQMVLMLSWFYSCDLYDVESKRCTDWDNRPNQCRGYPWYGQPPEANKALPPPCEFRRDIGQTPEPSS
jgi:Fe-S-cluster containining protein